MSTRRTKSNRAEGWLGSGLPAKSWVGELQIIVDALNAKQLYAVQTLEVTDDHYKRLLRETPPTLQDIVGYWQASGPNLEEFFRGWPSLHSNLERYWRARPLQTAWGQTGGVGIVHIFSSRHEQTPYQEALRFFSLLIFHLKWDKLGGPCARCGNYYIKRRASQKVYCSRRCGNAATAVIRTREKLAVQRKEKLHRAMKATERWFPTLNTLSWTQFVSREEPDITPKFLTRAVNKGDLQPPTTKARK